MNLVAIFFWTDFSRFGPSWAVHFQARKTPFERTIRPESQFALKTNAFTSEFCYSRCEVRINPCKNQGENPLRLPNSLSFSIFQSPGLGPGWSDAANLGDPVYARKTNVYLPKSGAANQAPLLQKNLRPFRRPSSFTSVAPLKNRGLTLMRVVEPQIFNFGDSETSPSRSLPCPRSLPYVLTPKKTTNHV